MTRTAALAFVAGLLAASVPARAHHGVAAVGAAGPQGPGAALETTAALPLPANALFVLAKTEFVSFQSFARAEPNNKAFSAFDTLALGFGLRPWLTAYVFQPVNVKSQDGVGTNAHVGDTNVMLALAFKLDEGLRLVPEKESLDELTDWHFSLWASCTLPVGPTTRKDSHGAYFAPDLQTGFGLPSPAVGLAVLKQLADDLTWLAELNYQQFFAHTYPWTRYRFGGETRLNNAVVWRLAARGRFRADLAAEILALHLQRDRERNDRGALEALTASGGLIVYAGLGVRLLYGAWSLALGAKRALPLHALLNEGDRQQGSEGLENVRASLTLGWSARLWE